MTRYEAAFRGGTIPQSVTALGDCVRELAPAHLSLTGDAVQDNTARAGWAAEALIAFSDRTGDGGEPLETVISDLLSDLRHLADATNIKWADVCVSAEKHYRAEVTGAAL